MSYSGVLLIVSILLPNLVFFLFPPKNSTEKQVTKSKFWKVLEFIENISRFAVLILPIFCKIEIHSNVNIIISSLMLISLFFYYFLYLKYFMNKREFSLLFTPYYFIPVPLAVFPVLCFIFYALLIKSVLFSIFVFIFAISHILISYNEYIQLTKN